MPLELVTPPALEPVSLDEAKAQLKLDTPDDDALVTRLIAAARARAEWHTGRAFVTQGWTLWLDRWPDGAPVEMPLPPLRSIASVTAYGTDDTGVALDPARYQVDVAGGRVALKPGVTLPAPLRRLNAIAIGFTAGYGDAPDEVPALIRQAMLDIVAGLYANRGDDGGELPLAALALLAPYRILKL
jgi:uncharacterized phiE125 gp8 family phage protein